VIDWANSNESYQKTSNFPFYKKNMEDTILFDLQLRVGEKYLYCHQGNCKHYIIFNQVRFMNDNDEKNQNCYPLRIFQSKVRRRKCSICEIYSSKWVTYHDKLSSENPTFYCDICYRQFHYSERGKLLYDDFEVFRYFHE
jgi:snRNA-activating protein complex subunit 3